MGIFEDVGGFYEAAAEGIGLDASMREALASAHRELAVQVRVPMDDGTLAIYPGYRVQHNGARGPFKGGVRFHPDVSLDHVRSLAALMTWKTSLMDLPYGGGKGGVQVDPKLLSPAELERLSRSFMRAVSPVIGTTEDIMAPDVNTDARVMGWMFDEYTRGFGHWPEILTGKPLVLGGSLGREEATGRGGLWCLDELVRARGLRREDTRVAVQGYGNAGNWFAVLAWDMGYRVVAVSDSKGTLMSDRGLDPRDVLTHKRDTGSVSGHASGESGEPDDLLAVEAEALIPAALERSITEENVSSVRAGIVVEVANHPVTPAADAALAERDATVVPDILASAGGVVVSYLEWVQNMQRERWTESEVNRRAGEIVTEAARAVMRRAEERKLPLRLAAYEIAIERVAEAERARGWL